MELSVVVVDDETPICDWLVYCIKNASDNYTVSSASNGEDAYRLILHQKPDLVFTDICMPGIDGLELMQKVLQVLPFTAFVVLTNYAEFSYARQAVTLGAKEYLLKSELRVTDVRRLLDKQADAKKKALEWKKNEIYANGYIDIYNLYRYKTQKGYAKQFWEEKGMQDQIPYYLLSIKKTEFEGNEKKIFDTIELVKENIYEVVAKGKNTLYIVIQSENEAEILTKRMADALAVYDNIGISSRAELLDDFCKSIEESNCALDRTFFEHKHSVIWYDEIKDTDAINHEELHELKQKIVSCIIKYQYEESEQLVEEGFKKLKSPRKEDVEWALNYCKRLVFAVEEMYSHVLGKDVSDAELGSWQESRQHCLKLIEEMSGSCYGKYPQFIAEALQYVHDHYMESISMAEVAQLCYHSPEYFSRKFKEEVGENFNAYLTFYRMDRAQELLHNTNLRVSEISEKVGYETPAYFSKVYKEHKGKTPEQERMSKK